MSRISKLDENVVNRIAAGEIIHRPANAIKELIENSLDAQSTSIKVSIKEGGLKLLQIQDNGSGIHRDDLRILCERFTTSKIRQFSDLADVNTYGFRGEALASISHVSHLSILSKTEHDTNAWRASYFDGAMVEPKPGSGCDPKPAAGNKGTTIIAEDLFFNVPIRRKALKSVNEEYNRIVDVITKYAVHNPTVSFVCKKLNSNMPDISTFSSSSTQTNIKALYGQSVSKELLRFEVTSSQNQCKCSGYTTSTNYASKRTTMLLFINHRLVDCPALKKGIENAYSTLLPKGSHPFIYIDLNIPKQNIDINVHPTKSQVHFLNEDAIVDEIVTGILDKITTSNTSKSYDVQTFLPKPTQLSSISNPNFFDNNASKIYPKSIIRTDVTSRTLDSFVSPSQSLSTSTPSKRTIDDNVKQANSPSISSSFSTPNQKIKTQHSSLTSIQKLRQQIIQNKNEDGMSIIKNFTFVGFVDISHSFALIQHNTQLLMVDYSKIAFEQFYQLTLNQFSNIPKFELNPPPQIRTLIELALKHEESNIIKGGNSIPNVLNKITNILLNNREMLNEYFSITINENGELEYLPLLLNNYTPNINNIPTLLMNLGPCVNWMNEQECFNDIIKLIAGFYLPSTNVDNDSPSFRWQIQYSLFPSIVNNLIATNNIANNAFVQVTNLPDLFRIFERC